MKLILAYFILFSFTGSAQDTALTRSTKYEEFTSENGVLKRYVTTKLGKVKGFNMSKTTVTNVETGKYFNAVEISEKPSIWGTGLGGSILVDEEELPSLIKVLKFYQTNVVTDNCKEECPMYSYETKGGVRLLASKTIGAYGSSWHTYLGKRLARLDLDNKDLDNLIQLLENYK